ncbi:U-box domain-containing protein 21-like [Prunus yedoensis var. nudiflora]|uniref:U-box domain-containing protein n=1 Tax=Prunus yedoensis var. nudiflora TaxID=2094558 RepID=A0A314UVB2_PRUYE|nr:U-box domain-containing protein 21-like [Prunus yedoensis var. nudiflora]
MILSWRRRKATRHANRKKEFFAGENLDMDMEEIAVPTHFRCPISLDLMKDPVTLSTGMTYDRSSIEKWIETGNRTCPATNQELKSFDQIPNHVLRRMIQDWCVENRSYGIERIPTPRIPVTKYEVSRICERIATAARRGDDRKCGELVGKIKAWGKESERNKKCMVENGIGCCLSAVFESFASISLEEHGEILLEILSVLPWMFPVSEEGQSKLGSAGSLRGFVSFLEGKDLSARQNAVLVLGKLLSLDQKHVDDFVESEGAIEALIKICGVGFGFFAARVISCDAERGLCERALGVLEGLCDCKQGKDKALENALTMPLLVKKILRISELGTEFSIAIIWKLCRIETEESILIEALQVGAFQKLLVLLQVGCGDGIKEKVTDLLKLFNLHTSKVDCVDSSMDFKYLKRPFLGLVKDEEIKAEAAKVFWSFLSNSRGSTSPNLDGLRLWNLKLQK